METGELRWMPLCDLMNWFYLDGAIVTSLEPFLHSWLRTTVRNKNMCRSVLCGSCADQDTHLHCLTESYLKRLFPAFPPCHTDTSSGLLIKASIFCRQKKKRKKLWKIYIVFSKVASRQVLSLNGSEKKIWKDQVQAARDPLRVTTITHRRSK